MTASCVQEQGNLLEGINQARQMLEDSEQRLRAGIVPQVFKDWANATDEAKAIMKVRPKTAVVCPVTADADSFLPRSTSADPVRPDQAQLPSREQARMEDAANPELRPGRRLHGAELAVYPAGSSRVLPHLDVALC